MLCVFLTGKPIILHPIFLLHFSPIWNAGRLVFIGTKFTWLQWDFFFVCALKISAFLWCYFVRAGRLLWSSHLSAIVEEFGKLRKENTKRVWSRVEANFLCLRFVEQDVDCHSVPSQNPHHKKTEQNIFCFLLFSSHCGRRYFMR